MQPLNIDRLYSGGLIANYYCSASCKHCLYGSSPSWPKEYMTANTAAQLCRTMKTLGCHSVHIGGGEPLLNWQGLRAVLDVLQQEDVTVEYVETNASWYRTEAQARTVLSQLKQLGVSTLLISISPFHNECVPLDKVTKLIRACQAEKVLVFPWQEQFFDELAAKPTDEVHTLKEWEAEYGRGYTQKLRHRFGLTMRGRALLFYESMLPHKPIDELLRESHGCTELAQNGHFHMDLFGHYQPGSCSGLAVAVSDLGFPLDPKQYPIITALYGQGVRGLFEIAIKLGFRAQATYATKCHLCMDLRRYLVQEADLDSIELEPREYYEQVYVGLRS